ncbi:cytoplasmic tRNA 2-thiolation protein 2-B-like [Ruditapes philippinarum]|uniref:cytoplasmic tRNA 2-thiolation protein 2-B-like n=1 Tax=Ruditapes philippinarum TaxID=129788 RepID=UPI00295BB9A6|nr:cytoplasmic tRNA 2-thiolation protein 2-B-like [Ruditapes philippinarum]
MCSVQDGDVPMKRPEKDACLGRLCMKCKEVQAVLVTRVNDAFCKDCFQVYVTHKFRAAIGKTKLVRDGEHVLVAYSGGPSSSALLCLIQEGLSQRAHKKLRFRPGVLFIDEGATIGLTGEERLAICEKIHSIMKNTGFTCYIKSLEEGFTLTPDNEEKTSDSSTTVNPCNGSSPAFRDGESIETEEVQWKYEINQDLERRLKETLNNMKSVSAKEDFIRSLRNMILLDVARNCGYSKVMLGSCGTQLAVRLLTDISTGRGAHAAMVAAFADRRHDDVMFLRPMRDFSSKEAAIYNSFHNVESVFIPSLTTKAQTGVSIEHLTESFVTGLQADYPSTVSNIMRTGEKLDSSVEKKADKYCTMCKVRYHILPSALIAKYFDVFALLYRGPLDTKSVGASSALSAVEFSQKISCGSVNKGDNSAKTGLKFWRRGWGLSSKILNRDEVKSNLCYGCRLIVRDMEDVNKLPEYVLKDVAWRNRRSNMKKEIEGFLLEDV